MSVRYRGYAVDFKARRVRRERDHITFTFHYTPDGIRLEPCGESMLPTYLKNWMNKNCMDYVFSD